MGSNSIPLEVKESIENVIRKIEDTHANINPIKAIVETLHTANLVDDHTDHNG
jgi:hypothetical protein